MDPTASDPTMEKEADLVLKAIEDTKEPQLLQSFPVNRQVHGILEGASVSQILQEHIGISIESIKNDGEQIVYECKGSRSQIDHFIRAIRHLRNDVGSAPAPAPDILPYENPEPVPDSSDLNAYVFVDNSNIFIGAQLEGSYRNLAKRVNIRELCRLIEDGLPCSYRAVAGSKAANSKIWKEWENNGYKVFFTPREYSERSDDALHNAISQVLSNTTLSGSQVLVLATGDGNETANSNSFPRLAEQAAAMGWDVRVWSWEQSLSGKFKEVVSRYSDRVHINFLDKHKERLTFKAGTGHEYSGRKMGFYDGAPPSHVREWSMPPHAHHVFPPHASHPPQQPNANFSSFPPPNVWNWEQQPHMAPPGQYMVPQMMDQHQEFARRVGPGDMQQHQMDNRGMLDPMARLSLHHGQAPYPGPTPPLGEMEEHKDTNAP